MMLLFPLGIKYLLQKKYHERRKASFLLSLKTT